MKFKRFTSFILALLMVLNLGVAAFAAENPVALKLSVDKTEAKVGDTITVTISSNTEITGIQGWGMDLYLDPDAYTFKEGKIHGGMANEFLGKITDTIKDHSCVNISAFDTADGNRLVIPNGTLATLTFEVIKEVESSFQLKAAIANLPDSTVNLLVETSNEVVVNEEPEDNQYVPDEDDAVIYQSNSWPSEDGYVAEVGVKDAKDVVGYAWTEHYGAYTEAVTVLMDATKYEDNTTFSTYFLTGGANPPEVEAWGKDADGNDLLTLDVTLSNNTAEWYMHMKTMYYMIGSKYIAATFVPAVYTLDKTELSLEEGASETIKASLTYYSGPSDWESSNEDVVTVDDDGNVTAVAPGTATITATVGNFTATCEVTVAAAQYVPDENDAVIYQSNSWPSEDGYVAEVGVKDAKDVVGYAWTEHYGAYTEAVTVLMDATKYEDNTTFSTYFLTGGANPPEVEAWGKDADGNDLLTLDVTLSNNTAEWYMHMKTMYYMIGSKYIAATFVPAVYTLDKTELSLEEGASETIKASLTYYSGPSDWESSNEDVVTVDDDGNVTAVAPGTATITATVGEFTATCEVTVVAPHVHDWKETTYSWAENGTNCTASRVCETDETHVEYAPATVTSAVEKDATCSVMGDTKYTATFDVDWAERQTKTITDIAIDADAHDWDEGKVTTEPTCSEVGVKTFTCKHNAEHTYTEDVAIDENAHDWDEGKVTTEPTCSEVGVKTFTCKHNAEHTYTDDIAIDADAHAWTVSYVWSKDGKSCTATRVCGNSAEHNVTAEATVTATVAKKATCSAMGDTQYKAVFSADWAETQYTVRTDIAIDKNAHEWGEWKVVTEPDYVNEGLEKRVCKLSDEHFEEKAIEKLIPTATEKVDGYDVAYQEGVVIVPEDSDVTVQDIKDALTDKVEKGSLKGEVVVTFMEATIGYYDSNNKFIPIDSNEYFKDGKTIDITLPYPKDGDADKNDNFEVYHYLDDGKIDKCVIKEKNDKGLVIEVGHLSPFVIAYENVDNTPSWPFNPGRPSRPSDKPNPGITIITPEDEKEEANPNTGAPVVCSFDLTAAGVVVLAATAAVLEIKRRK